MAVFNLFLLAAVVRVLLLAYAQWHDATQEVKFTDIDYVVFTDASRAVLNGNSVYSRATYRYTPALAWLLLPNAFGGIWLIWGKIIFSAFDLILCWLMEMLIRHIVKDPTAPLMRTIRLFLLFNPLMLQLSARGSSESLVMASIVASLLLMIQLKLRWAALMWAVSIHLKLFPVIFGLPFALYILYHPKFLAMKLIRRPSVRAWRAASTFFITAAICFIAIFCVFLFIEPNTSVFSEEKSLFTSLLEHPYVVHCWLHHVKRVDFRHNFSIFWFPLLQTSIADSSSSSLMKFNLTLIFLGCSFRSIDSVGDAVHIAAHRSVCDICGNASTSERSLEARAVELQIDDRCHTWHVGIRQSEQG